MAKKHHWQSIRSVVDVGEKLTPGMRSAARPFRVLEFFDEIRRSAPAREIADRLGLPQSTTSVLLKAMVAIGYLDLDPETRCYRPSLRVTLLGSWRDSGRLRAGALMSMIEGLAAETGLSASLSNRSGIFVRYVQTVQQDLPGLPHVRLAARRYAVWSTGGLALIASLPDEDIAKLLRRTKAEKDERAKEVDGAKMWDMVGQTRSDGWFCGSLVTPGALAVARAVPAIDTGYGEALALTLSNGTGSLGSAPERIARRMADAIAGLANHHQSFVLS